FFFFNRMWQHDIYRSRHSMLFSCYQKPKFGKYCLMSTKGSFTDFHVDIAGTSVWHYIYSGGKFFYLIPPTNDNINKLTSWTSHNDFSFLSDHVPECYVVHLTAENSLFMPSGIGIWRVKPRSFMNSNTDCDHGYIHCVPMCSSQKPIHMYK
ncbi:hypothetical protein EMCRGX_G014759, partial [Ephydatia muelleri]